MQKTYYDAWKDTQDSSLGFYIEKNPNSVSTWERADVKLFGEFIKTDCNDTVLDVGSGTGYFPGYMVGHAFKRYIGIDPLSAYQIPQYTRIQCYAELMPFSDDSFTVAVIGTSLDHILCLRSFWDELYRVVSDRVYVWTYLADGKYFNVPEEKLFDRSNLTLDNMPWNDYINDYKFVDIHHMRHLPTDYFEVDEIFLSSGFKVAQHERGINNTHHLVELKR